MKIKVLVAAVALASLTWLGMSFATSCEAPQDAHFSTFATVRVVGAGHPDSHRLGMIVEEEVNLPEWEEAGTGAELALAGE